MGGWCRQEFTLRGRRSPKLGREWGFQLLSGTRIQPDSSWSLTECAVFALSLTISFSYNSLLIHFCPVPCSCDQPVVVRVVVIVWDCYVRYLLQWTCLVGIETLIGGDSWSVETHSTDHVHCMVTWQPVLSFRRTSCICKIHCKTRCSFPSNLFSPISAAQIGRKWKWTKAQSDVGCRM